MTHQHPIIRNSAYYGVIGIHDFVDFNSVDAVLDAYLESLLPNLNVADLQDWKLVLMATYIETDYIGVFKRPRRYLSDKEIEVSISVPIPAISQAAYGMPAENFGRMFTKKPEQWWLLKTDYATSECLADYVTDAVKRAIDEVFKRGVSVNGKKIKYQAT